MYRILFKFLEIKSVEHHLNKTSRLPSYLANEISHSLFFFRTIGERRFFHQVLSMIH